MTRRRAAVAALAASLACAAAVLWAPGCTRDPAAPNALTFMIWGTPDEVRVVQGYLADFHREHPEVEVRVEHAPSFGFREKLQVLFLGGNPPDVMYVDQADLELFGSHGWLRDLAPLVERDRAEVAPDDFYPPVYERFRMGGRLFGVVKDFATLVCYYNRDLFDKWDVPYPRAGWTWDDFLRLARAVAHPDEGDWGFLLETWPEELFPWVWQAGAEVARDDPPAWLLGAPEHRERSAEALQLLSDLIWVHRVAPGPSVTKNQQGSALFLRGQVAMCTYGRWLCMDLRGVRRFDWDVVELPRHRRAATSVFAVAYGIAAASPRPEQAWTLVKFLTSRAAQEAVAHSAQAIPARRSVAESDAFRLPRALAGLTTAAEPHTAQLAAGRFSPRFRVSPEVRRDFQRGVEPLWNGTSRRALELIDELQPRLEAIIARDREQAAEGH